MPNKEFFQAIANNQDSPKIDEHLEIMSQACKYQSYLSSENFQNYQQFQNLCQDLKRITSDALNPLQQKVVNFYNNVIAKTTIIHEFAPKIDDNEGGVAYKYTNPNGFISAVAVIGVVMVAGVLIASIILSVK